MIAGFNPEGLELALDCEVKSAKNCMFAPSTKKAYDLHRRSYLAFCEAMGYTPVPATSEVLCRYAALLARSLKFSSLRQYLNIIRLMHLEWGLPNPLYGNFQLSSVLGGLRRSLGDTPVRKLPITPDILRGLHHHLDTASSLDRAVWAAALCLFYGMLRRSNVIPLSAADFSPARHLRRADIMIEPWGLSLIIRWSKTIQFHERTRRLPLPAMPDHQLCPMQAVIASLRSTPEAPRDGPAFCYTAKGKLHVLSAAVFLRRLRSGLAGMGLDISRYASHSFRRGSASFAYESGLSVETIRQIGDWKSMACLAYIALPDDSLLSAVRQVQRSIH